LQQIFQNVVLNRQEINSIEFEKEHVEIPLSPGEEETFEILITNYGSPTHIHLSVSEELKGRITFLRDNPYVLQKEYISAVARIPLEGNVFIEGQIYITAGYGSRKKGFPVKLGKIDPQPQAQSKDESYVEDRNEEFIFQKPSISLPINRTSRPKSGKRLNWFSSVCNKFKKGSLDFTGKKSHNIHGNEKYSLNLAFGGFLLLICLFFLYFILPSSLQFKVSFVQSLLFSILFMVCMIYILLKIAEES
jgi:hypothetical protein